MKDYYYILGLSEESDESTINNAYRKLSKKLHPDVNGNDEFFTQRFQDIQEAYNTLSNRKKRKLYDITRKKGEGYSSRNFLPIIDIFNVSQSAFKYDEPIDVHWKCYNADSVLLEPFGAVEVKGTKTYKIREFDKPCIKLRLTATNSSISKSVSATITLENITYNNLKAAIIKEYVENMKAEQLALDNAIKAKENRLPEYEKVIKLANGRVLQIIRNDKFMPGSKKVRIDNQQPADGFYFSEDKNYGYEIRNGSIQKDCYIREFEQKDGKTLKIASDRVLGIGSKSRAWINGYPAPTGKYRLSWYEKVNIKDGLVT